MLGVGLSSAELATFLSRKGVSQRGCQSVRGRFMQCRFGNISVQKGGQSERLSEC